MKQVLVILESPLFREYIRLKLTENGIEAVVANSPYDGISKMRSTNPNLIIVDYFEDRRAFHEFLRHKKLISNTTDTPLVIFAQEIEQSQLLELVPYKVKKVFHKPIKIDVLFSVFSEIMGVPFTLDDSPGIVEVHVNESIIFIEIAQGLNRDKLDILFYKISELVNLYRIRVPKVIIMLSDIKLSLDDSSNMKKLMNSVLEAAKAKPANVRVLTNDDFVRQYIHEQEAYSEIIVSSNLDDAIDGLLTEKGKDGEERAELIENMILKAKTGEDEEDMVFKFEAEARRAVLENIKESLQSLRIAVIDDDYVIQEMIKNTFRETRASVFTFSDGREFLDVVDKQEFDLAFLDINMPHVDGFGVLNALRTKDVHYPIIVLSVVHQREAMMRAIKMGIKSYLVKPLKPDDVFMKSIEILKANF